MDKTYTAVDDIAVLSFHEPAGPLGFLPMHAYLIKDKEPILVEKGLYTQEQGFLDSLWSEVDPQELRWIMITHEDMDHAGNLEPILKAAPDARVVLSFLAMLKYGRMMDLTTPDRVLIATPGSRSSSASVALGSSCRRCRAHARPRRDPGDARRAAEGEVCCSLRPFDDPAGQRSVPVPRRRRLSCHAGGDEG
jgi:Metallo-beta-lactamase superfamily